MKIGIIADDLTGANATGVKLSKIGFDAATMVYYDQPIMTEDVNTVCIDTDSRYAMKSVAQMRVEKVLENLADWGADVVCKRIDSTIRGNIGIEIDTVLEGLGEKAVAIVVASFPDSGRITSGGYLLVNGVPVQQTDVAKDPVVPLVQSFIPTIIQKQSKHSIAHIGLDTVLSGEVAVTEAIREKIHENHRIIVIDAVMNEEIELIANAMVKIDNYQLVPTDPGPLTAAYSKVYTKQHAEEKKVLVTVGSVTSHSEKQMHYLIDKLDADPVYVQAEELVLGAKRWEEEIERAVEVALKKIRNQEVLIITTMIHKDEQLDLKNIAQKLNKNEDYLAKRISDGLAKITRTVYETCDETIGGMFSSGGDVTASLCSIGGATGIKLIDEVMPLIAFGKFIDGRFDGISLVTKGGMVGDEKALYTSVQHLLIQGNIE